jgi:hypothetical protein
MKMNKIFFTIILIISLSKLNAQPLSVGYFPFNNTFSITSNPERLIMIDGRVETNTFFGNINPEIFGIINIKRSDLFNIYSGLSCKMIILDGFNDDGFIGGYSISLGSRFKPFEKFDNVNFLFELSPYFNKEFKSGTFRAYIGLSYKFKKHE